MEVCSCKRGIPSEVLKLIACLCMLIDHSAAVFRGNLGQTTVFGISLYLILRGIGRIAFPIYCWMMAEGVHYTRSPRKYGIRLAIGVVLSEIPFDYALHKGYDPLHQNVMLTLLIAFLALQLIRWLKWDVLQALTVLLAYILANVLHTDYKGNGVLLIILLYASRGKLWLQAVIMAVMCTLIGGWKVHFLGFEFPLELYGTLAMIPIALCSGKKCTSSPWVTKAFYLFYPGHLAVLWLLARIL